LRLSGAGWPTLAQPNFPQFLRHYSNILWKPMDPLHPTSSFRRDWLMRAGDGSRAYSVRVY
jgi:hypothetical protein